MGKFFHVIPEAQTGLSTTLAGPVQDSGFAVRWARRLTSVLLYVTSFLFLALAAPVVVPLCFAHDIVRRSSWSTLRLYLFILIFLCCEFVGILASGVIWLIDGLGAERYRSQFMQRNFRLQCWWGTVLASAATKIFNLSIQVEDEFLKSNRPVILMMRHASLADTLLPVFLISGPTGIVLRYVLKKELLWDPCLDIVGNRLINAFVDRASDDPDSESARVGRLMSGLTDTDGVIIYPEGTRFTLAKQRKLQEKYAYRPDDLCRIQKFESVLPPRRGGPLALLQHNENADVVFCAHTGLEGLATVKDIIQGRPVGTTIRVAYWTVPFEELPTTREDRERWLDEQWCRMDDTVQQMLSGN